MDLFVPLTLSDFMSRHLGSEKMKIFLDDEVKGRGLPSEWPHHNDNGKNIWGHALTVNEVIEAICHGGVDEISLDHDLGTDPVTGMDVLKWLAKQLEQNPEFLKGKLPREIYVHSCNIVAAPRMEMLAEDILKNFSHLCK